MGSDNIGTGNGVNRDLRFSKSRGHENMHIIYICLQIGHPLKHSR